MLKKINEACGSKKKKAKKSLKEGGLGSCPECEKELTQADVDDECCSECGCELDMEEE